MIKREELSNPNSCMSRARDDEMTFVLLGRDVAAPAAIRVWINERIRLGKNCSTDLQIMEAKCCVRVMANQSGGCISVEDTARALDVYLTERGSSFISVGYTVGNPDGDVLIVYVESVDYFRFKVAITEFRGMQVQIIEVGKVSPA